MIKSLAIFTLAVGFITVAGFAPPGYYDNMPTFLSDIPNRRLTIPHPHKLQRQRDLYQEDKNFSLSCLLFDHTICPEECESLGKIYGRTTIGGSCNKNQLCECQFGKLTLHQEWTRRFKANYVFNEILENALLLNEVKKIIRNPFQTSEQVKEHLRPLLSPFQFTKLRITDNCSVSEFIKEDGEPDREAVQKHISDELAKDENQELRSSSNSGYGERLKEALKRADKGTLYNIVYRLHQLKNPTLDGILEQYLKERRLERPDVPEDEQSLDDVFRNTFINEIIKLNDNSRKLS